MAAERGLTVDMAGYEEGMARHREISAAGAGTFQAAAITGLPETDDSAKYEPAPVQAKVLGWVVGENFVKEGALGEGAEAAVVLDKTPFYGEAGGQVGDTGKLAWKGGRFDVRDAKLVGHCVLHIGVVAEGTLKVGDEVTVQVGASRADAMRNHTATHLLNWALRRVLGGRVDQAGSVVEPTRLRFDFTHGQAVTAEQLAEAERLVNERILADEAVSARQVPLAEARQIPGVRAVFGENYPDPVRVVSVGVADPAKDADETSLVEFCGGTHVQRTSEIGFFKIVSEESVAKGIRRITAVTGHEAVRYVQRMDEAVRSASAALRVPVEEIGQRIAAMQKELKGLRKRPAGGGAGGFRADFVVESAAGKVLIGRADVADAAAMRGLCDVERQKGAAAMMVGAADEDKVTLVAMVSQALVKAGKVKAGEWVQAAAAVVGGSGGGKPTMAQAGGKEPHKLPQALQAAERWIRERLA
jgi:alanyl-tRNA synthetase